MNNFLWERKHLTMCCIGIYFFCGFPNGKWKNCSRFDRFTKDCDNQIADEQKKVGINTRIKQTFVMVC